MNNQWQQPVTIRPIGVVVSDLKEFNQNPTYREECVLQIRQDLTDGLVGIEHFSHIHVLYHQHRREEWKKRAGIPDGTELLTMPLMGEPTCKGIYTSRSPARPSGIGSCIVELLSRDENRLRVRGLDAVDGTPILDIKIYILRYDYFPDAVAPLHWCQKSEQLTTSRLLHWDTMSVSLTLGMRAGQRVLQELGVTRSDKKTATVFGGNFFAQGVEAVTGCSPMNGSMSFEEKAKSLTDWLVRVDAGDRSVFIRIKDRLYSGADEVLGLPDDVLFESVEANVPTVAR
ncbi:MAG: tRNA (N6-threonylcarbamoyladenosine(37)-N6)-methyltransferase TrmO [Terriglobales bacterium]|jgi:formylmethanofuran dehydrogenase subunit E